jgi:ATP-dependent DNA ligase
MATEALPQALHESYDGITAKRLASPNLPGRRSRDWINIKSGTSDARGRTGARRGHGDSPSGSPV